MTETGFSQKRTFPATDGETWWAYVSEAHPEDGVDEPELVFFCPATAERRRMAWQVGTSGWLEDVALDQLRSLLASSQPF